jgi:hypothetical protein
MHDALNEDPDIRQAIEDKIPDVAEIRDLAMSLLRRGDSRKAARVSELFGDLDLRAQRIGVPVHDLIRLVSSAIDANPQSSMRVSGKVTSPLLYAEREAVIRETRAHEALSLAQKEMAAATRARHHAQSRCLVFGIEVAR